MMCSSVAPVSYQLPSSNDLTNRKESNDFGDQNTGKGKVLGVRSAYGLDGGSCKGVERAGTEEVLEGGLEGGKITAGRKLV